jgi:hypothetical protein
MSSLITTGKALILLSNTFCAVGPYWWEWNETHIYNPRWPPHARFHNGHTMSMGLLLGVASTYFLLHGAGKRRIGGHFHGCSYDQCLLAEKNECNPLFWGGLVRSGVQRSTAGTEKGVYYVLFIALVLLERRRVAGGK